jgi:hypothetical protein
MVDAIEVKPDRRVTLREGDGVMIASTVTTDEFGTVVTPGGAYVERDGVLEVYPNFGWTFE